jgi:ubiquinone/menaquinone biosynthesis C-methylase UbiE
MKTIRNLAVALSALFLANFLWQRIIRRYEVICPTRLAGMLEQQGGLADVLLRTEETLDCIGLQPGQHVLEIGPGPGRLLIPAARRVLPGGDVVGLDIQAGMLRRLQERAARAGVTNLKTVLGDASRSNFPPDSFDVIYIATVLGEIPDRAAALRECYAACKPGGRLSITEILPDPHYVLRGTAQSLAESAGFRFNALYGSWNSYTLNLVKPQ